MCTSECGEKKNPSKESSEEKAFPLACNLYSGFRAVGDNCHGLDMCTLKAHVLKILVGSLCCHQQVVESLGGGD
jgi:hypothetical protein